MNKYKLLTTIDSNIKSIKNEAFKSKLYVNYIFIDCKIIVFKIKFKKVIPHINKL